MKVFIYGTLKKGFKNYHWMKGAVFLKDCKTKVEYPLIVEGESFPMLFNQPGEGYIVSGELFEVESLKELDRLEGAPHFFHQGLIELEYEEDKVLVYFFKKEFKYKKEELSSFWSKKYDEKY